MGVFSRLKDKLIGKIAGWLFGQLGLDALPEYGGGDDDSGKDDAPPEIADNAHTRDHEDFVLLKWACGGFDGSKALPCEDIEIGNLIVYGKSLKYAYVRGGCESLGAVNKTDYEHTLACLFCKGQDGKWQGGKFDWVSTSRKSRDFKNIEIRYKGWHPSMLDTAISYAFVIVSADGKKRSNVITG